MSGIGDLLGRHGVLEQMFLWNVVGHITEAMMSPAFTVLLQDVQAAHPEMQLPPDVLAQLVVREFIAHAEAAHSAAKSGIAPDKFTQLVELQRVRIPPNDLATAVLRSYLDRGNAIAQAKPQGIGPEQLDLLINLAGDAPGPDQLAMAERRGIIKAHGSGADSTSFDQGIREGRLHDKWAPILLELSKAVLSPQDAAQAVLRGFMGHAAGAKVAALSGVDEATFATMVSLSGDAPGPDQLAVALRRGLIPEDSGEAGKPGFVQGIREGRLADQWAPMIKGLAELWPSPVDVLGAILQGQVSMHEGKKLYERLGGVPEFFQWQYDARGSSPTPLELIQMANREYIPWEGTGPDKTSYEQGFLEGPWRNKWASVYRKYAKYQPEVSTVVTLLAHNSITVDQAGALLKQQGMDKDTIEAYLIEAHSEALSDYRGETVGMVLESYYAQVINATDALNILDALHVTKQAAELMLAYKDVQRAFTAVNNAISRIRSLYAGRKITLQVARDSLIKLSIPATSIDGMLAAWQIENSISVKLLTEAQIIDAWFEKILSDQECAQELVNIGYTPFDAWVLMSSKAKTPLPGKPDRGPAPPQDQVIGGTT